MSLADGSLLDHYEVLESIGVGGMGEVYRARDTRLPREVAIKVASHEFTERFAREAKVIASLNHPNICTLYDIGPNYLVMELVEGPTLEEHLKAGALSLEESTRVARQVADALDYAHDRNVVHRDLKPANIKIRPDGLVKVLDFGLAKIEHIQATDNLATVTLGATRVGALLGTPGYMAPEQAMGKMADKRADIWAFGVVFYEMLAGEKPFSGETMVESLSATMRDDPDMSKVPYEVRRLLRRCLEKDPQNRLRHVGDVMSLLDESPRAGVASTGIAGRGRADWIWPAATALCLVTAIAIGMLYFRQKPPEAESVRFQFAFPPGVTPPPGGAFSISPDGRKIVFAGIDDSGTRFWLRDLDTLEARPLEARPAANPYPPFWSPDSRFIAYGAGITLYKTDIAGGAPEALCQCGLPDGTWNRDGVILLGAGPRGILRISADGGQPVAVTAPDRSRGEQHAYPVFLPDGKHFLYLRQKDRNERAGIYAGSIDAKPQDQSTKMIVETATSPVWLPPLGSSPGYLFYQRDVALMAQPFDMDKLELTGEAMQVAVQGPVEEGMAWAMFSAAPSRTLAYRTGGGSGQTQLTWFDRSGKNLGPVDEPGRFNIVSLSPDGMRAALVVPDVKAPHNTDIWVADLKAGTRTRLTFGPDDSSLPIWSPDGTRIAYNSRRDQSWGIYERAANGAAGEELIYKFPQPGPSPNLTQWSPDGRQILYHMVSQKTRFDIWTLPLGGKPMPFLQTEFQELGARFSPDGRWIAYRSDESGRNELYVQAAPGSSAPPGKWLISKGSLGMARWRRDSREIYYLAPDGGVMAVEVTTTPTFQAGPPKKLFDVPPSFRSLYAVTTAPGALADVTPDGQRFLFAVPMRQAAAEPFNVVVGWRPDLKK